MISIAGFVSSARMCQLGEVRIQTTKNSANEFSLTLKTLSSIEHKTQLSELKVKRHGCFMLFRFEVKI